MQEIQFLEFMGGSNLPQAFPNYLIFLRFIRISMVFKISRRWSQFQNSNCKHNCHETVHIVYVSAHDSHLALSTAPPTIIASVVWYYHQIHLHDK